MCMYSFSLCVSVDEYYSKATLYLTGLSGAGCSEPRLHVCTTTCMCSDTLFLPPLAQFIVHVRCPGVVALQNVKQPHLWLKIKSDELTTGGGGRKCELRVKDKGQLHRLP